MTIKGKDSRININIFLGQASNMHENDNFSDGEDLLVSRVLMLFDPFTWI